MTQTEKTLELIIRQEMGDYEEDDFEDYQEDFEEDDPKPLSKTSQISESKPVIIIIMTILVFGPIKGKVRVKEGKLAMDGKPLVTTKPKHTKARVIRALKKLEPQLIEGTKVRTYSFCYLFKVF